MVREIAKSLYENILTPKYKNITNHCLNNSFQVFKQYYMYFHTFSLTRIFKK